MHQFLEERQCNLSSSKPERCENKRLVGSSQDCIEAYNSKIKNSATSHSLTVASPINTGEGDSCGTLTGTLPENGDSILPTLAGDTAVILLLREICSLLGVQPDLNLSIPVRLRWSNWTGIRKQGRPLCTWQVGRFIYLRKR